MASAEYNSRQFKVYLDAEKAWEIIEYKAMGYDRDIDELYPDEFITERNKQKYIDVINKLLIDNEEYTLLEDMCEGYALTSFGRVINCKYGSIVIIYFTNQALSVSIRGVKIDFAGQFMKMGWLYDIDKVKRIYNENKWLIKDKNNNLNTKSCPKKK